jgi:hypothetical protein
MDDREKAIILLLEGRNMLFYDVLSLSESVRLNNDDAETYVEFMEARQERFDEISEISAKLEELGFDQSKAVALGSLEFRRKAGDLFNDARATSFKIKKIDDSLAPTVLEIKSNYMEQVRALNTRKSAKELYSDDNLQANTRYFDQSK